MRHRILLVILCVVAAFNQVVSAQTGPSMDYIHPKSNPYLVPPGPETASFLQYGQIPVSYSTGIPDISYPIYTIRSGSLTLPITLNYLGGGVKVTDQASWVGLGWLLNAGGVIHRSINDLPDKLIPDLPSAEIIRQEKDTTILNRLTESTLDWRRTTDKMRDRYDYTFAGKAGAFYIMNGGEVLQVPYTDNIIKVMMNEANTEVESFKITDAQGTSYHFETHEKVVVSSRIYNHQNGHTSEGFQPLEYTSAWYLTKIEDVNKLHTIEFKYATSHCNSEDYLLSHFYDSYTISGYHVEPEMGLYPGYFYSQVQSKYTGTSPVLSEIIFSNGSLVFNSFNDRLDDRTYRLTTISLFNTNSQPLNTVEFTHSYFAGNRLKLDKVEYKGSDDTIYDSYSFDYYNEDVYIPNGKDDQNLGLRNFGSQDQYFSRDLCGYYNGKQNTTLLSHLPSNTSGYSYYLADRRYSAEHAKVHSLRKITYITGGYTELTYDDNISSDQSRTPGIRIKEIYTSDGNTERRIRYSYSDPIFMIPYDMDNLFVEHSMVFHHDMFKDTETGNVYFEPYIKEHRTYISSPLIPGYEISRLARHGKVEEIISGSSEVSDRHDADTIRNVYEFDVDPGEFIPTSYYLEEYGRYHEESFDQWWESVKKSLLSLSSSRLFYVTPCFPDDPWPETYNIPGYFIDYNWANGHIVKESQYKYENGEYVLCKTIENTYKDFLRDDRIPIGMYCKPTNFHLGYYYLGAPNHIYLIHPSLNNFYFFDQCVSTGWRKLVSISIKEYDGNIVKHSRESFQYDNIEKEDKWHPYVTFISKTLPDGSTTENYEYLYPASANGIIDDATRLKMLYENMISPVIRKTSIVMSGLQDAIKYNIDKYELVDNNVLLRSSSESYDGYSDGLWEKKTEIKEYDSNGNPVWITDDSGSSTVIIWGYNNSLPVAQIQNATPEQICNVLNVDLDFKTMGNDLMNMMYLMQLRALMPEAQVFTYTYQPLVGMISMTDPAGTIWNYTYDTCGRLKETSTSWIAGPPTQTTKSYEYHYHNH